MITTGQRVVLFDSTGETAHARVNAAGPDVSLVALVGAAMWLHRIPTADLHPVCGVCPDCRALNERPSCMVA